MLGGLSLTSSSPSTYQIDKARKHAGPTSTYAGINSVLNSGSTAEIDDLSRRALQDGFLEVESNGCRSLIYPASYYVGTQFDSGRPTGQLEDSFRVVLSSASSMAHGYPVSSTKYTAIKCAGCGSALTS
jgi:hypothetical protein